MLDVDVRRDRDSQSPHHAHMEKRVDDTSSVSRMTTIALIVASLKYRTMKAVTIIGLIAIDGIHMR